MNNKLGKLSKNIEIPKKKNNFFLEWKKFIYTFINNVYYFYNNNNDNNKKRILNNNSSGALFNIINTNNNITSNFLFKTSKKQDWIKTIYVNPNFTEPYTKPKCIYKDKKYNGISVIKII